MWPLAVFSRTASLRATECSSATAPDGESTSTSSSMRSSMEHVPGEEPFQRRLHPVGFDVGEVAELTEVHADHRHIGLGHERHGPQHGAVPAEAHGHVEPGAEVTFDSAQLGPANAAGVLGREANGVAEPDEPVGDGQGDLGGLGAFVVDDQGEGGHLSGSSRRGRAERPRRSHRGRRL